jgi:hypothetical protein
LQFLLTELKPFIDAHYRTLPAREDTFMMGLVWAGSFPSTPCEYPTCLLVRAVFTPLAGPRWRHGGIPIEPHDIRTPAAGKVS